MKKPLFHIGLLVLLISLSAFSSVILVRFEALSRDDSMVVIRWQARGGTENGVQAYGLLRRTGFDQRFEEIKKFDFKGPGELYEYVDRTLYKAPANEAQYQLQVHYADGPPEVISGRSVSVDYTSTAVRRTWGSIKAMFQ